MMLRLALFAVLALGLAGMGGFAWEALHPAPAVVAEGPAASAPPPAQVTILAAAHTLRAGALLKAEDIAGQAVTAGAMPAGARVDNPAARAELLGAMLRRTLAQGEALLPADVMRAGDRGFLAAVLGPGKRAISVGVDAVSGTAGLIWPGDHVDLILTQTIGTGAEALRQIAGETVLHDARVIAIDQELMQGATPGAVPGNPNANSQERTVTLEVTPEAAEHVAVASQLGHLALVVIAADAAGPETAGTALASRVTWGSDVSAALQRGGASAGGALRLFEGGADGKEYRF